MLKRCERYPHTNDTDLGSISSGGGKKSQGQTAFEDRGTRKGKGKRILWLYTKNAPFNPSGSPGIFQPAVSSPTVPQLWELRLEMVCGKGKESSLRVLFASLLEKNTSDQIGRRTTFLFRLIIRSKRLAATLSKSSMGSSANSYPQPGTVRPSGVNVADDLQDTQDIRVGMDLKHLLNIAGEKHGIDWINELVEMPLSF